MVNEPGTDISLCLRGTLFDMDGMLVDASAG